MPFPDDRPLPARLRRVLSAVPEATALTFEGRTYPWEFLQRGVDDLDRLLAEAGAPDAHRIGIVLRNRPGHLAALIAVIATGRQVVTLSPFHGDVALAADIATLAPQVVVAGAEDWARSGVAAAAAEAAVLPLEVGEEDRPLLARAADWTVAPRAAERCDVAVLMQTSGTTGSPKRVELTYSKLTAAFESSGTPVGSTEVRLRKHPAILWTSLVHIGGLYFAIANVAAGLQTALLERFDVPLADLTWFEALTMYKESAATALLIKRARKSGTIGDMHRRMLPALAQLRREALELVGR